MHWKGCIKMERQFVNREWGEFLRNKFNADNIEFKDGVDKILEDEEFLKKMMDEYFQYKKAKLAKHGTTDPH